MSEQPPLDATFFAFKKRERSFVLTSAAIAYYLLLTQQEGRLGATA